MILQDGAVDDATSLKRPRIFEAREDQETLTRRPSLPHRQSRTVVLGIAADGLREVGMAG